MTHLTNPALIDRLRRLKREITYLKETAYRRNRQLDALHFVWCTGGCANGLHRYDGTTPTADEISGWLEDLELAYKRLQARHRSQEAREDINCWACKGQGAVGPGTFGTPCRVCASSGLNPRVIQPLGWDHGAMVLMCKGWDPKAAVPSVRERMNIPPPPPRPDPDALPRPGWQPKSLSDSLSADQ